MAGEKNQNIRDKGILLIITGPSGVGKDTVISEFLKRNHGFKKLVTDTSRLPRAGETQGKDYNFFTREKFLQRVKQKLYLEHVEVRPNEYKGTSKEAIQGIFLGKNIIWKIDEYSGAHTKEIFKKAMPEKVKEINAKTLTIYIAPEEWSQLREQYFARESEANQEWFLIKLKRDKKMWGLYRKKFDRIIVNRRNRIKETVREMERIIMEKQKKGIKK
ncbi:MAG: hypothetical protein WCX23_03320 [Candidatus Paceibacterota bacterium]|jgi:guanylate kinase|nr:hypothetical protein [Candidatus Paceibacterota bacterium]MDD4830925.1 hypothetical protein [Candidatus Paceibacterota bacterium]MDD4875222.1 hypothetical protein [Candidatus Paceibacterota bacterium]